MTTDVILLDVPDGASASGTQQQARRLYNSLNIPAVMTQGMTPTQWRNLKAGRRLNRKEGKWSANGRFFRSGNTIYLPQIYPMSYNGRGQLVGGLTADQHSIRQFENLYAAICAEYDISIAVAAVYDPTEHGRQKVIEAIRSQKGNPSAIGISRTQFGDVQNLRSCNAVTYPDNEVRRFWINEASDFGVKQDQLIEGKVISSVLDWIGQRAERSSRQHLHEAFQRKLDREIRSRSRSIQLDDYVHIHVPVHLWCNTRTGYSDAEQLAQFLVAAQKALAPRRATFVVTLPDPWQSTLVRESFEELARAQRIIDKAGADIVLVPWAFSPEISSDLAKMARSTVLTRDSPKGIQKIGSVAGYEMLDQGINPIFIGSNVDISLGLDVRFGRALDDFCRQIVDRPLSHLDTIAARRNILPYILETKPHKAASKLDSLLREHMRRPPVGHHARRPAAAALALSGAAVDATPRVAIRNTSLSSSSEMPDAIFVMDTGKPQHLDRYVSMVRRHNKDLDASGDSRAPLKLWIMVDTNAQAALLSTLYDRFDNVHIVSEEWFGENFVDLPNNQHDYASHGGIRNLARKRNRVKEIAKALGYETWAELDNDQQDGEFTIEQTLSARIAYLKKYSTDRNGHVMAVPYGRRSNELDFSAVKAATVQKTTLAKHNDQPPRPYMGGGNVIEKRAAPGARKVPNEFIYGEDWIKFAFHLYYNTAHMLDTRAGQLAPLSLEDIGRFTTEEVGDWISEWFMRKVIEAVKYRELKKRPGFVEPYNGKHDKPHEPLIDRVFKLLEADTAETRSRALKLIADSLELEQSERRAAREDLWSEIGNSRHETVADKALKGAVLDSADVLSRLDASHAARFIANCFDSIKIFTEHIDSIETIESDNVADLVEHLGGHYEEPDIGRSFPPSRNVRLKLEQDVKMYRQLIGSTGSVLGALNDTRKTSLQSLFGTGQLAAIWAAVGGDQPQTPDQWSMWESACASTDIRSVAGTMLLGNNQYRDIEDGMDAHSISPAEGAYRKASTAEEAARAVGLNWGGLPSIHPSLSDWMAEATAELDHLDNVKHLDERLEHLRSFFSYLGVYATSCRYISDVVESLELDADTSFESRLAVFSDLLDEPVSLPNGTELPPVAALVAAADGSTAEMDRALIRLDTAVGIREEGSQTLDYHTRSVWLVNSLALFPVGARLKLRITNPLSTRDCIHQLLDGGTPEMLNSTYNPSTAKHAAEFQQVPFSLG